MTPPSASTRLRRDQLAYQVAQHIADQIRTLEPGDYLPPQGEYSRQFEVSRPVVREAFRLLEARGLIEMRQGRLAVVRAPDHSLLTLFFDQSTSGQKQPLQQLIETRMILEIGIVELAAERVSDDQLRALRQALDEMYAQKGTLEGFIDADISFHVQLAVCSGNEVLRNLITALREQMRTGQIVTRDGARRRGDLNFHVLDEHEEIYRAVASHDARAARKAMWEHLQKTMADLRASHAE